MFRHKNTAPPTEHKASEEEVVEIKKTEKLEDVKEATIKELLEKNLKWSQIIYEQNRKINNKLLWTAVAGWIKIVIIVVPIVLAVIYLAPFAKNFSSFYGELLTNTNPVVKSTDSLEQIMKLLPINSTQQEQIKAILK